ncbi:MAG: hypothetical protein D6715_07310 [Calditrichaeota bacterium]|nr:MAG: hypothetical protein D6715_07310 [Calditrichota bacterium]
MPRSLQQRFSESSLHFAGRSKFIFGSESRFKSPKFNVFNFRGRGRHGFSGREGEKIGKCLPQGNTISLIAVVGRGN